MCCLRILFFIFLILILHLFAPTLAQLAQYPYVCSDNGNYISNSTYRANRNTVLASMSSNTKISYGGDIGPDECRSCVNASSHDLLQNCPNQKEVIIWSEKSYPLHHYNYIRNAPDADAFTKVLGSLLARLKKLAAAGSSTRKFAVGSETFQQNSQTIHALLMCTPDLDELDCKNCLEQITGGVFSCCSGKQGGIYLSASCNLRYETFTFYDPIAEAPPPSLLPPYYRRRYCRHHPLQQKAWSNITCMPDTTTHDMSTVESLRFDFGTITKATDNFSDENKFGEGGFGAVYKGILENGLEIAVKRLSMVSGQGRDKEFGNEVLLVARLQHRNLVRLSGFCLEGKERLLIYEFVRNVSLDRFIFASNILLDENMNPKISDFGIVRLLDQTQGNTGRIIGARGYMLPEYAMQGNFSSKFDIFSFGVLLLEIVSGQRNSSFPNEQIGEVLIGYAWKMWREGTPLNLVDPTMKVNSIVHLMRCIHIGLLCVQENKADRPTTALVILMLFFF
ncbi:hypothetical protein CIPAW_07G067700 [Carya illinoinensis]|uniref:Uncharacterized protein n=1 Tax=Carya illinoinensis TaxID=32201 RepID=A0A8T1PVR8_CARIL|nr:hypothetical protein CIPAW_07G067700 [Carya illinoinensis]